MIYRALLPIVVPAGGLVAVAVLALICVVQAQRLQAPELRHSPAARELLMLLASPGADDREARQAAAGLLRASASRCLAPVPAVARLAFLPVGPDWVTGLCRRELALLDELAGTAAAEGSPAGWVPARAATIASLAGSIDEAMDGAAYLAMAVVNWLLVLVCTLTLLTAAFAARRVMRIAGTVEQTTSALRESEARNRRLAEVDEVTQLANRTRFGEYLEGLITAGAGEAPRFSLLFIDLDGFKGVNDTLSHAAGDELLRQVGLRLNELVRDSDMVARLGGDEFVVLARAIGDEEQASAVAARIVSALGRPYEVAGVECHVTASVGVTLCPDQGSEAEVLLRNADLAMYEAKRLGKNGFVLFNARAESRVRERVSIETALRRALPRGELSLVYQPIVSLATMRARSAEALLRWRHPVLGEVPPGRFVPIAEESGLILEIGNWVVAEACRQVAAWRAAGAGDVQVAINVTHQQIAADGFHQALQRALADNGLPGEALLLEITERALMERGADTLARLRALADLGVGLALDDFGTGYSSLSRLHTLPIDAVKIDRSFLRSDGDEHRAIVLTILGLARVLEIEVVAEGVEDEGAGLFLADAGCSFAQGFFFCRPGPAGDIDWRRDYSGLFHPDSDLRRLMRA